MPFEESGFIVVMKCPLARPALLQTSLSAISDMIDPGLGGVDIGMGRGNCFKGRQFTAEVILWAVRWYLMFPVSYRDLELMLLDRGVEVDHTTIFRWLQAYAEGTREANPPASADMQRLLARGRDLRSGEGTLDLSTGRSTAEGTRSISFCRRGGIRSPPSGSSARRLRSRMS
jgi:hypothetical protein